MGQQVRYVIPEDAPDDVRAQLEENLPLIIAGRETLIGFSKATFTNYQDPPHIQIVAEALEEIERGDNRHLMIFEPPRHGKSLQVSTRFPAWALCRRPDRKVISASYGDVLATEMGRLTRNTIMAQELFPRVELEPSSKAKNLWHIKNYGGQFYACGIGSGVVGWGGDLILVDDPFKKREEAESALQREAVHNWWTSELLTRQEPDAALVLVMHRWHEDDLAGRLLADEGQQHEGGKWKVVRLPAVWEGSDDKYPQPDLLGRAVGDALWADRYSKETLDERRREIGERDWNSLYQQRPSPSQGEIFKWFQTYERLPNLNSISFPFDMAYTKGRQSDYTAWAAWGRDDSRAYLIDAGRFKGEIPEAERFIQQAYWRLKDRFPNLPLRPLYRGNVGLDRTAAQHMSRGTTVMREGEMAFLPIPVIPIKLPPGVSKEEIANIISPEFESGRALIPEFAPFLSAWIDEHKGFPHGQHDDYVETTNLAIFETFRTEAFVRPPVRSYL